MPSATKARRAPGQGSIWVRTDKAGKQTWYGKWGSGDGQIKRKLGLKRKPGTREGLTQKEAGARLQELMRSEQSRKPAGRPTTVREAGEAYIKHLTMLGRKPSTLIAVEMILRVHLVPFVKDKSLDGIQPEDVDDFLDSLTNRDRPLAPKSIRILRGDPLGAVQLR